MRMFLGGRRSKHAAVDKVASESMDALPPPTVATPAAAGATVPAQGPSFNVHTMVSQDSPNQKPRAPMRALSSASKLWASLQLQADLPHSTRDSQSLPEALRPISTRQQLAEARPHQSQARSYYTTAVADVIDERVVIAMVGLPARGKSYISKAIVRYLQFLGVSCKLFNAGNKRRDQGGAGAGASFFDPSNKSGQALKEQMAMETLEDLFAWFDEPRAPRTGGGSSKGGGGMKCGIFDATNTTRSRRRAVLERCVYRK